MIRIIQLIQILSFFHCPSLFDFLNTMKLSGAGVLRAVLYIYLWLKERCLMFVIVLRQVKIILKCRSMWTLVKCSSLVVIVQLELGVEYHSSDCVACPYHSTPWYSDSIHIMISCFLKNEMRDILIKFKQRNVTPSFENF